MMFFEVKSVLSICYLLLINRLLQTFRGLKQQLYYLTVFVGQEFRPSLAVSHNPGPLKMPKSRCGLELPSLEDMSKGQSVSRLAWGVVGRV